MKGFIGEGVRTQNHPCAHVLCVQEVYKRILGMHVLKVTNSLSSCGKIQKIPVQKYNHLFNSKHVHYCQKVTETDSFLSTAHNSIVIAFKFTG